jgi:hypothetical protein
VKYDCQCADFHEIQASSPSFVKETSDAEFHDNESHGSVADTTSQTDGCSPHISRSFLLRIEGLEIQFISVGKTYYISRKTKVDKAVDERTVDYSENCTEQLIHSAYKLQGVLTLKQMLHTQRVAKVT